MDSGEKNEIQYWKKLELCATYISKSDLNVIKICFYNKRKRIFKAMPFKIINALNEASFHFN